MMTNKILVVDDEHDACESLRAMLEQLGFEARATTSAKEALEIVGNEEIDVVLTDLAMSEISGIEFCERVIGTLPTLPVIVVTGQGTLDAAIQALRAGVYDFLTKPIDATLLKISVDRARNHRFLQEEIKRLKSEPLTDAGVDLIGESKAMKRVFDVIARVRASDASVMIQGETGTGKELVARALHRTSLRKAGPFVSINCAAIPHALIESELFGHARNAFTDAKSEKTGLFLQANAGTLFLDEIGELPIELQPKLLRVLQERKVRPVGSTTEVNIDVRILCATNRDLEYEIFQKRFREDLFYRVNVVTIQVPPLRERPGDILLLAHHFLNRLSKSNDAPKFLSESVAERLIKYEWPGNVRELENCMERAMALSRFDQITVEDLPMKIRGYRPKNFVVSADDPTEVVAMDEVERRYILRVLGLVGGNKSHAAQLLGFDRRTLYRKLARYESIQEQTTPELRDAKSSTS